MNTASTTENRGIHCGAWGALVCLTVFLVDANLATFVMGPLMVATLIGFVVIAVVCHLSILMRVITAQSDHSSGGDGKKLAAMEWIVWLTLFMAIANLAHFPLAAPYVAGIVAVALVSACGYYWLKSHAPAPVTA